MRDFTSATNSKTIRKAGKQELANPFFLPSCFPYHVLFLGGPAAGNSFILCIFFSVSLYY